jgi:hypothetical protein
LIDAIFKFTISVFENGKNVIDIRPWVMFAFMPALRALLKCFVIAFLVLFNQPFQADIAANFKS